MILDSFVITDGDKKGDHSMSPTTSILDFFVKASLDVDHQTVVVVRVEAAVVVNLAKVLIRALKIEVEVVGRQTELSADAVASSAAPRARPGGSLARAEGLFLLLSCPGSDHQETHPGAFSCPAGSISASLGSRGLLDSYGFSVHLWFLVVACHC